MKKTVVLLVEDNPLSRRLIYDLLEISGYEVIEAGSVEEGRARLREMKAAIVLTDIGLPGGGGELLLKEIRSDAALARLPVIAVTALAMRGDRERLILAGFDGYLSKPIDTRTFCHDIEVIRETTGRLR